MIQLLVLKTLKKLLPDEGDILVVGLGNRRITADALGSRVLDDLLVTRHLQHTAGIGEGVLRSVCALAPGVLGVTGMEMVSKLLPERVSSTLIYTPVTTSRKGLMIKKARKNLSSFLMILSVILILLCLRGDLNIS